MKNFKWLSSIIFLLCFAATNIIYGDEMMRFENDNDEIAILNTEIEKTLSRPNKWGYKIQSYPHLSSHGLEYLLSYNVYLTGKRYTSVDEVERVFVDIYTDFIKTMNSMRPIRP